jgi:hypothetical protein
VAVAAVVLMNVRRLKPRFFPVLMLILLPLARWGPRVGRPLLVLIKKSASAGSRREPPRGLSTATAALLSVHRRISRRLTESATPSCNSSFVPATRGERNYSDFSPLAEKRQNQTTGLYAYRRCKVRKFCASQHSELTSFDAHI